MSLHTIGIVKFGLTAAAAAVKGITNSNFSPGLQRLLLSGSGQIEASHGGIVQVKPELGFSTTAIKTALANLGGADGIAIDSAGATEPFEFWFQKALQGGLKADGANHVKCAATYGMIIPQTLSMPAGDKATLSYRAVFLSSDGTTAPVTITDSVALDAGQAGADEAYVLGPVTINGTALANVSDVQYEFGLNLWEGPANPYLQEIAISSRRPKLTVSTNDGATFADWGLLGETQGATDSVVNLYPVSTGAIPTSTGAITLTVDEGVMEFGSFGGQHGEKAAGPVTITPMYDGTADTVAIAGLT